MQKEVKEAIDAGIELRSEVLSGLTRYQRVQLLELLFQDFFVDQHRLLQKWASLTGQTAQIDTGYIAQFVASIITGIPGQGFRGKGDDLVDGSEVKSAANISGVDTPRWNHNMGTAAADEKNRQQGKKTNSEKYLEAPLLFYLLADRITSTEDDAPPETRIRAWCVDVQADIAWRSLVERYNYEKSGGTYNLQLHPPVGYNDNLVTNTTFNLDFSDVLVFDYRIALKTDGTDDHYWNVELPQKLIPISGRTKIVETVNRAKQKKTHTAPEDLVADIAVLPDHFPVILDAEVEDKLDEVSEKEGVQLGIE
ncbi:MamI family restriction endonuclease [Corynebacterium evansiae]|uniref:MamI family restriction endonuclease n=1 Tax=Corynebacterium evansiae TaxID=2913499 RepID=A0A9X3LQN4_9CORY|nr:MamI family restriction endonuclease [Corynebacterium evansiae]MCZ9290303.1 MamI family restriction endonuclease [Corynebacterium evansiae]